MNHPTILPLGMGMGIPTQINNSYRRCFFGRNLTPTQNTSDLFAGFTEIASGADFKWNKNARNKSFLYPVTNGALWAAGISQSLESGVEEKELMTVKVTPLSTFFFRTAYSYSTYIVLWSLKCMLSFCVSFSEIM